ncbi:nucleotide-diphospho-sugar transferase [Cubamyces menziesii]|nr:nucleotide-diphospho-sugar transferase [Cubamyces menziesii]
MRVLWNPKYYAQWQGVLRPWTWGWLYWTALVSVALNVFWVVFSIVKRPQPTVFDRYTKIHNLPLVDEHALSDPHPIDGHGNVIATSFFTDEFATAIAALGHSLNRVNTTARRLALYIPEQVSPRGLCIAGASGFTPYAVERISPPDNGAGIFPHFVDQFTKLRIWELGEAGARGVVYLDADTLAVRNFDELFALPFGVAAAPDVYTNKAWGVSVNAGVLFLRPSAATFRALRAAVDTAPYWRHEAEQALLNAFFAGELVKLPYAYNANLAIKAYSRRVWEGIKREIRVIHYTMVKPFTRDNKNYAWVPMEELEANARRRSAEEGGIFVEEMEYWAQTWRETYALYGERLRYCMTLSNKPGQEGN